MSANPISQVNSCKSLKRQEGRGTWRDQVSKVSKVISTLVADSIEGLINAAWVDAQLLHARDQRRTLKAHARRGSLWASNATFRVLQDI
jgi:hypothetical protein